MAVANYIFPNSLFRKITVIATAVVLIISAGWLHFHVGLNPQVMAYPQFDRVILALDLAILAYITFVAVQRRHVMLLALAVLQIVSLGYLEFFIKPNMSIVPSIVIDRLSVVMYLVISVVGSIIAVYALKYMEEHEEHIENKGRNGRFFLWFIAFLGIMNGLVFSNNLFWFYFFWEATTLCSFQLIGHDNSEEARNNAMRALFYNSIGGLALIAGLAMLIRYFGPAAGSLMSVVNSSLGVSSTVFVGGLALFALAGFTKAAQFPFQSWLLGAMVAPTPVSALLHSSTMVKAGVYLILRLAPAYSGVLLSTAIALVGAFTFFAASFLAVCDDNAKRVLAYSTVANLGLIIACCGLNTPLAINAAVLLIIFHAVSKAMLFMGVGVIEHNLGSRNIENMEGLAAKMPAMTLVMTIGAFSMFLPPFGMLFSKWAALEASLREPLLLLLFVAASTLTALFWTKWLGRMIATVPGSEKSMKPIPMSGYYVFSLGTLALGAVLLSFGIGAVVYNLAAPAEMSWYPQAIQGLPGMNMAAFSWTGHFNPEIVLGSTVFFEGMFPIALLFSGLLLTLLVPLLLFNPEKEQVSKIYLSGENAVDNEDESVFVSAMEGTADAALGGYYFRTLFNVERLNTWLNLLALAALAFVTGVVFL